MQRSRGQRIHQGDSEYKVQGDGEYKDQEDREYKDHENVEYKDEKMRDLDNPESTNVKHSVRVILVLGSAIK